MKKFITLSVIVLLALNASAQFQKGNKVLGFSFNLSQGGTNSHSLAGYQVSNGFGVGTTISLAKAKSENRLNGFLINLGYTKASSETNFPYLASQLTENYNAGAGYFMRRYKSLGRNFFVFGEATGMVNYSKEIFRSGSVASDANQYNASVGIYPGLAYKWNECFLLEIRFADFATVSYNYQELKGGNNRQYSRGLSLGTSLGLGYLNNIGIGARWIIK